MKKVLNTDRNKLNWRFNQTFFSDHKPGHLLYVSSDGSEINNCEDPLNDSEFREGLKIILCHLNINSIRNKIDILASLVRGTVDIMLISESKIDDSFPTNQFLIPGFSTPYRKDRDGKGGGVLLYVRQDIPSKCLNYSHSHCEKKKENLFIEINLHKKKWLIGGSYNPSKSTTLDHTNYLSKCLDYFSTSYDNIIILGDFNCEPSEPAIIDFCDIYNLKNLVPHALKTQLTLRALI